HPLLPCSPTRRSSDLPTDNSVSSNRGVGWVVSPQDSTVYSYAADVNNPFPQRTISGVGHPRVVEAGTNDASVWVGNEEGTVYRRSEEHTSELQSPDHL